MYSSTGPKPPNTARESTSKTQIIRQQLSPRKVQHFIQRPNAKMWGVGSPIRGLQKQVASPTLKTSIKKTQNAIKPFVNPRKSNQLQGQQQHSLKQLNIPTVPKNFNTSMSSAASPGLKSPQRSPRRTEGKAVTIRSNPLSRCSLDSAIRRDMFSATSGIAAPMANSMNFSGLSASNGSTAYHAISGRF